MFFPDKKIILVHIPKTGGSSLESAICENSFGETDLLGKVYEQFTIRGFFKKEKSGSPQGHRHSPISEYNDFLDLKEYSTFTILRNPFSQIISLHNQIKKWSKFETLEEFVLSDKGHNVKQLSHYIDQYKFTHINNELKVNNVFVYDRYHEAQEFVEDTFKIKINRDKRLFKTEYDGSKFNEEMTKKIESLYRSSIDLYQKFL
jgi:hypothetical protein